jgi:GGDEF domain-containing protein
MSRLKPIAIELKFGLLIGLIILATTLIGTISKWQEFYDVFAPNGVLLNWRFVFLLIFLTGLATWFIMNYFWLSEQDQNKKLELKNEELIKEYELKIQNKISEYELKITNLRDLLRSSELEHLSDPITGIPNVHRLEKDFDKFFLSDRKQLLQFVFIDLRNFGEINKQFLSQKTNKLIRYIAQNIYLGMRRNENMFKFPTTEAKPKPEKDGFYRIFPGGDEFAFILEGDQSEALGFINRLHDKFKEFTEATEDILGSKKLLSFYCSVIQVDQQDKSLQDIFERAEICYRTVWNASNANFAITWYPAEFEKRLSKDEKKAAIYKKTRELFEVVPVVQSL